MVAEIGRPIQVGFRCKRDQWVKAIEQHDDAIGADFKKRVGKVAFDARVTAWIVNHIRANVAGDGVTDGTEFTQIDELELRLLVMSESGRSTLKFQCVLPPDGLLNDSPATYAGQVYV